MPRAVRARELGEYIAHIRPWLLERLERMNFGAIPLPGLIHSPLHGLVFTVMCLDASEARAIADGDKLCVAGRSGRERLAALQAFFINASRQHLPAILSGFTPASLNARIEVKIGNQRSSMGICRISKNQPAGVLAGVITINWRAAFLPGPLLRHLWLHEAAHLRHANHSRDFYACLENLSPQARQKEKELNKAWRAFPDWLLFHD